MKNRNRVTKRKRKDREEKKSPFAFISGVEEDSSLTTEDKINAILQTLTRMKIEIDQTKDYPFWINKPETKKLLAILNIEPGKFKFADAKDKDQNLFKQVIHELLLLNMTDSLSEMLTLIDKHWDLFKKYKFPNRRTVVSVIIAIHELVDKKEKCYENGEILLTGLYNSIFHQIYQMNGYKVKGDVLKGISFEVGQPEFKVKCDSYTYFDNNILSIREDKDSKETDWEKISTDGYKAIIVSRALLRENLRKFCMEADDVRKYSKFLAITTNIDYIHCFVLECSFDENWNPSYHLSLFRCMTTIEDTEGIISVVEFICRYVRDSMTKYFRKLVDDSVTIGATPLKNAVSQISHVSTILRSTKRNSPMMLNKRVVIETIQESNIWVVKSALILKKVDEYERYIYAILLSQQVYCPYLPAILKYGHEYMELEKLEQIDIESDWDEDELINLLVDMSCALKYLHSINVMHRDVKPNNILSRTGKDDFFAYVLIDFNLSCHFERKENGLFNLHTNSIINENCGTSIFRAPEVAKKENYSEKIDIFSLGMTTMYLFDREKMAREFEKKRDGCNWFEVLEELSFVESLKNVIRMMIQTDSTKRPTAEQLERILVNLKDNEM